MIVTVATRMLRRDGVATRATVGGVPSTSGGVVVDQVPVAGPGSCGHGRHFDGIRRAFGSQAIRRAARFRAAVGECRLSEAVVGTRGRSLSGC